MNKTKFIGMVMYGMGTGGAEIQFLELADYLQKKYKFKVYAFAKRGNLDEEFLKKGINLTIYDYQTKIGLLGAFCRFIVDVFKDRPDTIISTSVIGNIAAMLAVKLVRGIKIISFQTVARCMSRYIRLDRLVLKQFDILIAGADQIKTYLVDHQIPEEKIRVIHNWVDFENKRPTRSKEETYAQFGMDVSGFTVGCIARLHEQKGHIYLIRSFALLRQYPDIKLYLVGDGPEKEALTDLVQELALKNTVFFLGEQRGEEYLNLLNSFDMFVLPSLYEGLPRTLLDAMYLKKTIVATAVDGNVEAIEDRISGILVNPKDPSALAKPIIQLYLDRDKGMNLARNSFSAVLEKFDMNKQFAKLESYL